MTTKFEFSFRLCFQSPFSYFGYLPVSDYYFLNYVKNYSNLFTMTEGSVQTRKKRTSSLRRRSKSQNRTPVQYKSEREQHLQFLETRLDKAKDARVSFHISIFVFLSFTILGQLSKSSKTKIS